MEKSDQIVEILQDLVEYEISRERDSAKGVQRKDGGRILNIASHASRILNVLNDKNHYKDTMSWYEKGQLHAQKDILDSLLIALGFEDKFSIKVKDQNLY